MIDSLSVAELGHFALVLSLSLALIQSTVPLIGLRWGDGRLVEVARTSAVAAFGTATPMSWASRRVAPHCGSTAWTSARPRARTRA